MQNRFSKYSLWLSVAGIIIAVGQYFTPLYNLNILYIGIVIYLIGFICGVIAIGKHEKGLMKYFSLYSFVLIPVFIFFGFLFLAFQIGEK